MLCFCETWLGDKTPDESMTPEGYMVYRADRNVVECGKTRRERNSILGDFNHCNLRKSLPKFYQFVTFPTRGNNILDHCYSNIKNAYTVEPKPYFGKTDHIAILLKAIIILEDSRTIQSQLKLLTSGLKVH